MKSINIEIPEDILLSVKLPKKRIKEELKKELALYLYKEGILSLGPARRLANMDKVAFHLLLGQRRIERHYDEEDYEKYQRQIARWMKK